MLGIKQIKADGTEIDLGRKHLTLAEAQGLVATGMQHALIEGVGIPGQQPYTVGQQLMYVNEEGLLHDLPLNEKATKLTDALDRLGQYLVGDAIIVENEKSDFSDGDEE